MPKSQWSPTQGSEPGSGTAASKTGLEKERQKKKVRSPSLPREIETFDDAFLMMPMSRHSSLTKEEHEREKAKTHERVGEIEKVVLPQDLAHDTKAFAVAEKRP